MIRIGTRISHVTVRRSGDARPVAGGQEDSSGRSGDDANEEPQSKPNECRRTPG